jgi:hypothetical protein
MLGLVLTPAVLAVLLLAAHFLRRGQLLACAACIGVVLLLFVRRAWSPRVAQVALALGTLEWIRTLVVLVNARRAEGGPWERLALILGSVIALTLLGAALLGTRSVTRHYSHAP